MEVSPQQGYLPLYVDWKQRGSLNALNTGTGSGTPAELFILENRHAWRKARFLTASATTAQVKSPLRAGSGAPLTSYGQQCMRPGEHRHLHAQGALCSFQETQTPAKRHWSTRALSLLRLPPRALDTLPRSSSSALSGDTFLCGLQGLPIL